MLKRYACGVGEQASRAAREARNFFIGDARGRIAGWTLHESVRVSNLQNQIPALNTVAPHI